MPTLQYKFQPRSYQVPLLKALDSGIKRAIAVWHRRSGKDLTAWNYMIGKAMQEVGVYYYFLPTYTQGKKIIWESIDHKTGLKFLDYIPPQAIQGKPNETEMKIELVNGSLIQIVGADNVDRLVGTNPIGCVFSEYSLMKSNVWDYIRPILTVNGGWAMFIFTPRGMNHAWTQLQIAEQNEDWFSETLSIEDTGVLTTEEIQKESDEGMPQDMIDQEFYCRFIEGAGQFFKGVDRNITTIFDKPEVGHRYQMGVDLGKYQDYTVMTIVDLHTFQIHKQERFNQMDWVTQKAKIEAMYLRYRKPLIYLDSTGLGDPIYDDLLKKGIRVESFKFTYQSRTDLLNNLKLLLEQDKIKLPEDPTLASELKSFQYAITKSGKIKVEVPEGLHDDMVMSLALAVWNIPNNPLPKYDSLRYMLSNQGNKETMTYYE